MDNTDYCLDLDGRVKSNGRLNIYKALQSILPDQPIVYFDHVLLPGWNEIWSDGNVNIDCPITATVAGSYKITLDLVDAWNFYTYPNDWESYVAESVDKIENLSGSDIITLEFSEGIMWNIQFTSVAVIRIFDSGDKKLAEEICTVNWIPPVKK